MLENDGRAPSKEDQVREAQARKPAARAPAKTQATEPEIPPDPVSDPSAPELDLAPAQREPARGKATVIDPDAEKAPVMGKSTRDEIVKRFRAQRSEAEKEDDGELREFNQQGMPLELTEQVSQTPVETGDEDEPEPVQAAAEEEPEVVEEAGEPIYVLKVRGKEIEVTEEQLEALAAKIEGAGTPLEKAQKAAAGDEYLKEAREAVAEAKRLRDEVLALRGSPSATHPGAQVTTKTTEPAAADGDIAHPDDPFAKAVEAIQFGQPEEAARILREAVTKTTATQARGVSEDAITDQQMRLQRERANRVGKAFEEANQELANDPFARDAIMSQCIRLQVEDLRGVYKQLGIDEAVLPFPKTADQIAHFHTFYRTKGLGRDPETLLNASKDQFLAWKNGGTKPAAAEPPKGKPRVEISVERRVRRASIPQQPSRTVNPRPDVRPQQQPAPQDRSSIVLAMKAARNAPKLPPKQIAAARAS